LKVEVTMVDANATLESAIRSDTGFGGYLTENAQGMELDRASLNQPKGLGL